MNAAHDALARLRAAVESFDDKASFNAYMDTEWTTDRDLLAGIPTAFDLIESLGRKPRMGTAAREMARRLREIKRTATPTGNVVHIRGDKMPPRPPLEIPGHLQTLMPPGYVESPAGLLRIHEEGEDPILLSCRMIAPVALFRDIMTGAYHVEVAWQDEADGSWTTRTVARSVVADARKIVALSDYTDAITSVVSGDMVRWFSAVQQHCDLPVRAAASAFGWQDEGRAGFLWGSECIGGEVELLASDGIEQLGEGFRTCGDAGIWREIWDLVEPYPAVGLAVYAAIAPVILGIVREAPAFTVDWSGKQQGGKSTTMQLAASVWGDPMALISTWEGSSTGIERTLAVHRHLPTLLDDTKQASDPSVVTEALYRVTGRKGKIRGSLDSLRRSVEIRTVLLSTGERAATSFTEDAGAHSRCLSVQGPPFGASEEGRRAAERVQSIVMDHFGHIGPAVVRYLVDRRAGWPELIDEWVRLRKTIHERKSGSDGRGTAYLATLLQAALLLERACGIKVRDSIMNYAEQRAAAAARSADRPLEALKWTWSWLDQNRHRIALPVFEDNLVVRMSAPDRDMIAVWPHGEGPGVVWAALKRDMGRDGFAIDDIEGEWVRRGWIGPDRIKMTISRDYRPWVRQFTDVARKVVDGEGG